MRLAFVTTDNREHYKDYSAPEPYFGTAPEALLSGLSRLSGIEVHVISCLRQQVNSPEKLAENSFFHGLHVSQIGWMRTAYLGCIRSVRNKLRQIRPDVVHGQGTERECAICAVVSGFPNVVTIHGNMRRVAAVMKARPFSFLRLAARLELFTLPRSGGVVCLTQHTRREVNGLARKTWVVPNAVDESFFEIQANPGRPAGVPQILCVGQVYSLKNQNTLIRGLDPLAGKFSFRLVFLGEAAPQQPYAREFLSLVAARPWCVHVGFANRDQLKGHLRNATVLAQPTLEDNCPMAVLEAMAAGVPILASKVGGMPDLVQEGETGWFCDPQDPASITKAFERLLLDPSAVRVMGEKAKKKAVNTFHPLVVAKQHVEIYREVVEADERDRRKH